MKTILIICIFALSVGALYNSNAATLNREMTLADSIKVDPVCKMKVKPSTSHKSTYQKQEYWFCAKGCKMKFDKNPVQYLKK
ncbi:YHS domain-containing protein [Pedobacter helvus]|uniref:YHS domain-containing protein n=1 Tax=Pedobacter helvus TaxID=2563444 RepID=A0ABW9JD56_9SPHI|nr:YHS domain-containing protein [Pedobacter ureilyticus]